MSVLEARAQGVPVIVSDAGGLPEMVANEIDGKVVTRGDVTGLRAAVTQLATDRDLAARFGITGYRRLQRDNTAAGHYEALLRAYSQAIVHRDSGNKSGTRPSAGLRQLRPSSSRPRPGGFIP